MASYCWAELKSNQHGQKMEQFLDNAIFFLFYNDFANWKTRM